MSMIEDFSELWAERKRADEALLASNRVVPRRLTEAGFTFRYAGLEASLRHLLGRGQG